MKWTWISICDYLQAEIVSPKQCMGYPNRRSDMGNPGKELRSPILSSFSSPSGNKIMIVIYITVTRGLNNYSSIPTISNYYTYVLGTSG